MKADLFFFFFHRERQLNFLSVVKEIEWKDTQWDKQKQTTLPRLKKKKKETWKTALASMFASFFSSSSWLLGVVTCISLLWKKHRISFLIHPSGLVILCVTFAFFTFHFERKSCVVLSFAFSGCEFSNAEDLEGTRLTATSAASANETRQILKKKKEEIELQASIL